LAEAEELFVRATEASKKVLGDAHPDTLSSVADLELTYHIQGRWDEESLELAESALRSAHIVARRA
jgi:hypothetical protein